MPQENSGRKVKSHQQMIQALELRAAGASFRQIGEALSVSKPRAFRIVRKALDDWCSTARIQRSACVSWSYIAWIA